MSSPVVVVKVLPEGQGDVLWLWCPGCDDAHTVEVRPGGWTWDGDTEAPTIDPSIRSQKYTGDAARRCHAFLRQGRWEFLADCDHALAGETVGMVPLPDWVVH